MPINGTTLAGMTLSPGVYSSAAFVLESGVLTFNALNDSNATFILVSPGSLVASYACSMELINGAQADRVFWALNNFASLAA